MARQALRDFPRQYKPTAEALIQRVTSELRKYMLNVVSNAELRMQDRQNFRTPEEVLRLAVEGFGQALYDELKTDRDAADTVTDLLSELGIEKGGDK